MLRLLTTCLSLALLVTPAWSQNLLEVLESNLRIESRLFDGELERYNRSRVTERQAHDALRASSDALDRAFKRGQTPIVELEKLEAEVTAARETAYAASNDLAAQRRQLYQRMAKVAEVQGEIDWERGRHLVPASQLDGFWEFELQPSKEVGLLRLRVEGTLITGTYRLSGPRTGSVRGTLADNKVDLERIDNANGFDSVMKGEFNPATRQISGGWTAVDLSGGRLAGGTWKARRLSPAEEENLQVDPLR